MSSYSPFFTSALIAFVVASAVWSIPTILHGNGGIESYRAMQEQVDKLTAHKEELLRNNKILQTHRDALEHTDPDVIAMYAQTLGLAGHQEQMLRIHGLMGTPQQPERAGEVIHAEKPAFTPDSSLKTTAYIAGICVFLICLIIFRNLRRLSKLLSTPTTKKTM